MEDFASRGAAAQRAVDQVLAQHTPPMWTVQRVDGEGLVRIVREDGLPMGQRSEDLLALGRALNSLPDPPALDDTKRVAIANVIRRLRARVVEDGQDVHDDGIGEGRGRHHEPFKECSAPICVSLRRFLQDTDDAVEKGGAS